MVQRQLPKPSELLEFMQFKKPSLDFAGNRLQSALTIYDLRRIAKRRTPAAAFDYTDGVRRKVNCQWPAPARPSRMSSSTRAS